MPSEIARTQAQAQGNGRPADRRAFERFPADVEVVCRPLGASRSESWHARLQNISTGGVGLLVERRFEAGTMLAIDLAAPAQGRVRSLMARVMHVEVEEDGEWRLGVALLRELTPEELRAWGADVNRPETPDGRAWARFACAIPGRCTEAGDAGAEPWRAEVVDISPGGFAVLAPHAARQGDHVWVDVPASDGQAARRLLGRVVHVRGQGNGPWLLGCESTGALSEGDRNTLLDGQEAVNGRGCSHEPAPLPPSVAEPTESSPEPRALAPAADPELTCVCSTWAALPAHVRQTILVLVRGCQGHPEVRA
jgi:hypothetical protein